MPSIYCAYKAGTFCLNSEIWHRLSVPFQDETWVNRTSLYEVCNEHQIVHVVLAHLFTPDGKKDASSKLDFFKEFIDPILN